MSNDFRGLQWCHLITCRFFGSHLLNTFYGFYARQLYRQVLLRTRISYGNSDCPSVRLSVTTRCGFKAR